MSRLAQPTVRLRLTLIYSGLFLVSGAILLALMYGLLSQTLAPPPPRDGPPPELVQDSAIGNEDLRTVEERLHDARSEERANALRQVQIVAGVALIVTSVGALGLGWVISGRVLRPVRDITAHARQASETNLDERIELQGPSDELKELADTIDDMLDRLHAAFESQRRFAAQASHELRTPLAIMGAEADLALADPSLPESDRELAQAIRKQVTRSERLVEGLLVLARSESTMRDDLPFDLADLTGDIVGEHLVAADAAGIRVELDLSTAMMSGDPVLVGHAIGNLFENAIRYNTRGGFVRISVEESMDEAMVRVENSGRLIQAAELEGMLRPFHRGLDQVSRKAGGFGLGLAIVRSVTSEHGGHIEAQPRADGGLLVEIRLPSHPAGNQETIR